MPFENSTKRSRTPAERSEARLSVAEWAPANPRAPIGQMGRAKVDWVPRGRHGCDGASGPLVAGPIRTVALQAIDNGYMCGHSQQNWINHSCYT